MPAPTDAGLAELDLSIRDYLARKPQGVDVLQVSADFDKPRTDQLVAFLTQNGIDFPTYLKTEKDADFMKGLEPDWSGAIPATFLYSGGQLVDFWEGMATYETFARKAKEALAAPSPAGG